MGISRIGVVLNGDDNDKLALQTAIRLAAREQAPVRLFLSAACSRATYEKHVGFALRDVQARLALRAPEVTIVSPLEAVHPQATDITGEPASQEVAAWTCG